MRTRRFPKRSDRELTPGVVDVLIGGWAGPTSGEDDPDPFRVFAMSDADLAGLWRAHEAALRAEAARRGISSPWGATFSTGGAR